MRITIGGPPGSGKSTVCRMLSERLGQKCVISGEVFRSMAEEQGMTLEEFGRLAEEDPKYDRMLDQRMVRIAEEAQDIILEGRLTAHMLQCNGISASKVYLDAELEERARRVAQREGISAQEARNKIVERERSEASRYSSYYDIDISDKGVYDIIVDTTHISPEQAVEEIMQRLEEIR